MADLLHVSSDAYANWIVAGRSTGAAEHAFLDLDAAESVISIHRRLSQCLPKPQEQSRWLFMENKDFDGRRPIDIAMSSLDNLYWLNYYVGSSASAVSGASGGQGLTQSAIRTAPDERSIS